jgi:two-component system, cell cycle sensor histidine kinase and response regulator CckA
MKLISLRAFLTRLIWLCVLPLVILATYLAIHQLRTLQAQRHEEAANQVHNITTAIDRQLRGQIAGLQVLAASPLVDDPSRLHEFFKEALAFRAAFGGHVVLADPSTQMLFNTREPLGAVLPKLPRPEGRAAAPVVLETGKPAVGDMFVGPVAREPLVAVVVPVVRDGATTGLLVSTLETSQFEQRLSRLSIPPGWSLTLLDGKNEVIARRSPPEMGDRPDNDQPSERFVAQSAVSPWSVVLEVPRGVYRTQIMVASVALAIAILAATLISVLGGRIASRRLTRSVTELAETQLHIPSQPSIAEIEAVRGRLIDAAEAREKTEAELIESERRYRDLYENAPDMYASVDATTGHLIQCNKTMARVTGFTKEEIVGRPVFELCQPVCVEEARTAFQVFRSTGEVHNAELQLRCKDGSRVDVILNASAVFDETGRIAYSRSVLRDITDRKQAEEALRENEERLKHALEVGQFGSWGLDLKSGKAWRSLGHDQIFGYQELLPEWSYRMFLDHVLQKDVKAVDEGFGQAMRTRTEWSFECRIRRVDGVVRWIWAQGRPRFDADGEPIEMVGLVQDITDRKAAEQALRQSEERRRLALDAANAGTWEWDLRTNENFWSEELWGLYGLEPHSRKPSYEAWLETIDPDDRTEAERAVQEAASTETELTAEWRTKDGKGKHRWLMSRGRPLRDSKGRVFRYMGIVVDITDRKRSEQIIRESEKNHRLLIENLQAGVIVFAPDMSILLCNQIAADTAGMPQDEMIGQRISYSDWSFLREDGSPMPVEEYPTIRVAATLQPIADLVVGVNRPGVDGPLWVLSNAYPALNEKNVLEQIVVTFVDITDRKRAEAALAESEQNFRLLYEEAPIPYQSLDEEGYLLQANTAWLRLLGYTRDEVIGKNFADFLSPRSRERFRDTFSAFKSAGEVYGVEHEMVCKDKSVIEVSVDGRISRLTADELSRTHCVLQDITERKKAEKALQESEQRYRAVFNIASVGIDLVDRQGRFMDANAALSQFLGYAPEEILNLTIFDVTHPEDLDRSREMHEAMVRGETESYRFEKRYVGKDGAVLWADTAVSAIRDAYGQHRATVGVICDITQQKKSEEARVRLAAAVEQAAETVVITDPQGTIVYANPAFERITGYSRDEVIGNNPRILKSGHQNEEFYKRMWETLANGRIWTGRFVNKKEDGTLFEEDASISPVKNASGEIVNYVAVKRDVTQEVLLQRQLLQAQKMEAIGTLAGGIAHDFNNLLTVVHGFSELLLAEKDQDHPEYADLKKVLHAAESGAELVRRLLTFSRKSEPKPVPMNLNKQIVQVEKLLRRTIPRMVDIDLNLSPDLPAINADPSQVEQVLMNLAVNARDAMPEAGKLTVRTSLVTLEEDYCRTHVEAIPGEYVVLEVADTGHGMDPKTVEHIFEPFFTTKEMGRGTGLGLAIVYGIVKQHNGHITVYSEVGIGTTFRVFLPTIPAELEPEPEDSGIVPAFGTETVLLVDDEELVRELGVRILSKHGYTVLQAVNGRVALDLFRRERSRISLVILDLIMPEMGGAECLRELLQIDQRVNVLVASGFSADASVRKTVEIGAKGFVSKPFRVKDLLRDVRRVLDEG